MIGDEEESDYEEIVPDALTDDTLEMSGGYEDTAVLGLPEDEENYGVASPLMPPGAPGLASAAFDPSTNKLILTLSDSSTINGGNLNGTPIAAFPATANPIGTDLQKAIDSLHTVIIAFAGPAAGAVNNAFDAVWLALCGQDNTIVTQTNKTIGD